MGKSTLFNNKEILFISFIIILGSILIFSNLTNIYLWQDEACVALISRNVLNFGQPLVFDGKNVVVADPKIKLTNEYKYSYVNSQTWLEYYITALSFLIFGVNTFAARLPFALFGLGTIIMSYLLYLKINCNKTVAKISIILLVLSVPFLLHIRQVNYYSLSIFFTVFIFYSYINLLNQKKYSILQFVISNVLLFYSFFIITPLILFAILIHFILFNHYKNKVLMQSMFRSIFLIAILVFPSFFYFKPFLRIETGISGSILEIWTKLKANLLWINNYLFPFILLIFLCFKKTKIAKINFEKNSYLVLFSFYIVLVLVSTAISSDAPFFRYLVSTIPLFAFIAGSIIYEVGKANNLIAGLILATIISCNFLSIVPIKVINKIMNKKSSAVWSFSEGIYHDLYNDRFKSDFFSYLYELTHDYDCPVERIVKYLKQHANPEDIVKISYNDIPLMFYTDLRIISWRDSDGLAPDWIIPIAGVPMLINEEFSNGIKDVRYKEIIIDFPNYCYNNLPEPIYHNFKTVQGKPLSIYYNFIEVKEVPKIVLFRKIK